MKTIKLLRNLLLVFWFGWFALAGVIITGLLVWLTPLSLSLSNVLLIGSGTGIIVGGTSAALLLFALWRKFGVAFLNSYLTIKMIREAVLGMNTNKRR